MHELSLAQNICDAVTPYVTENQKIIGIVVECGPFSGVVKEALEYCFAIVSAGCGLDEAKLEVKNLRAKATCPVCGNILHIDNMWAACDGCGHTPLTVNGGREFRIKEIEIEEVNNV